MTAPSRYARSVFINCPFDDDYVPTLLERYERFRKRLPAICQRLQIRPTELTFVDFTYSIGSRLSGLCAAWQTTDNGEPTTSGGLQPAH